MSISLRPGACAADVETLITLYIPSLILVTLSNLSSTILVRIEFLGMMFGLKSARPEHRGSAVYGYKRR